MKAFFEEYGLAIIIAIVILLLVVMASPVGTLIKEALEGATRSLSETANKAQTQAGAKLDNISW